ncbi:peptidoglycan-associated lipoprotein Pal [Sphingomonas naphthae]|uniref:Peptidoglycan-associated lipoprotein n=1 Tax=Sphingomonas naphthae TaxID=1813468 RepID=A0ABY7TKS6_9SPHN|nr:peptidoglycan-associated lipoprotein Pal [Sphingomonas naphthae]WCT72474.1 peptidoglycan-associated lipoprotein Pal [Sphingomonas naphthae]
MTKTMTKTLLVGAALLAIAGCAKKPPAQLPPAPATSTEPTPPPPPSDVGSSVVPGSRADFLAQSGTDTVHFGTDMYDIDSDSQMILSKQAVWLKRYPAVAVTIEGHADERGTREYNLALGDRRANAAKNFLVSQGISSSRLSTISYGKERPVANGSDESAWAENRRAVTVVPQ